MSWKIRHLVVAGVVAVCATLSAQTTEVGLEGQFSNLYLRPERTPSDVTFNGLWDLYLNGNLHIQSELAPGIIVKTGYDSDPVLRRKVYAFMLLQLANVTFTVGPYYGLFNTARKWFSPGLNLDLRLDVPELLFLTIGFDTNFSPILTDGDYFQSGQRAGFGFYVPFGIITLYANYRTFQTLKDNVIVRDERLSGGISTEVFFKNFPLRYAAVIEFDSLQKDYVSGDTHQLMSLIFGNRLFWEVNPGLALYLNGDVSVFTFAWEELIDSVPPYLPLGRLGLGMRLRFFRQEATPPVLNQESRNPD